MSGSTIFFFLPFSSVDDRPEHNNKKDHITLKYLKNLPMEAHLGGDQ